MADESLFKIEMKIANMEKFISELNEVVIGQGKAIARLEKEVKNQKEQLLNLQQDVPHEKPPHY